MNRKGVHQHHYTAEHLEFLKEFSPKVTRTELAQLFNSRYGTQISMQAIRTICSYHKFRAASDGRFKNGSTPWCAGIKGDEFKSRITQKAQENMEKGQFGIGRTKKDQYSIGSELWRNGYICIKVSNDKKLPFSLRWKFKHVHLWEQSNGPIPKGHIVIFKDGNNQNFNISNLMLISRAQNAVMSSNGWHGRGDFTEGYANLAKLINTIGKKQREKKEGGVNASTDNV